MQADETDEMQEDSPWCYTKKCSKAIKLCRRKGQCCTKAKICSRKPPGPGPTTPGPVLSQVEGGLETEEVQGDETEEEEMQADETDEMQEDSPWCRTKKCSEAIKLCRRKGQCCTTAKICSRKPPGPGPTTPNPR